MQQDSENTGIGEERKLLSERLSKGFQKSWSLNWAMRRARRKECLDEGVEMQQIPVRGNKMSKCVGVGKCGFLLGASGKPPGLPGAQAVTKKGRKRECVVEHLREQNWDCRTEERGGLVPIRNMPTIRMPGTQGQDSLIPGTHHSKPTAGIQQIFVDYYTEC